MARELPPPALPFLAIIACIGGPVVPVPLLAMPVLLAVDKTVPVSLPRPILKSRQHAPREM